jgi:hypothetical protein
LKDVSEAEMENQISSIVLRKRVAETAIAITSYSNAEANAIQSKGVSLNALFHGVRWINNISEKLVPISSVVKVKRGERRGCDELFYPVTGHGIEGEYIKSVLRSSANLSGYSATADADAFCCDKSIDELRSAGHQGALNWITKFENLKNGVGKPWPEVLKHAGRHWYEMKNESRVDFVTSLNPNKRLFVAVFEEPTFVNQRLIGLCLANDEKKESIHALLNSILEMFVIEATGFGRGMGALDLSVDNFRKTYMLNPELIDEDNEKEILCLFDKINNRDVLDTEDEIAADDRIAFDSAVFRAFGIEDYHERIIESLLSMQRTRLSVVLRWEDGKKAVEKRIGTSSMMKA